MPRSSKKQSTILDYVIEDKALADALAQEQRFKAYAADYRTARKAAKDIITEKYPDVINMRESEQSSGYAICGNYRFRLRNTRREAGQTKAGLNWQFKIQRALTSESS